MEEIQEQTLKILKELISFEHELSKQFKETQMQLKEVRTMKNNLESYYISYKSQGLEKSELQNMLSNVLELLRIKYRKCM